MNNDFFADLTIWLERHHTRRPISSQAKIRSKQVPIKKVDKYKLAE
jgi:hypothetical protein